MKKDRLALEAEGHLVQRRQVSLVMVERSGSILLPHFFFFLSLSFLFESQLCRFLGVSTLFIFSLTHEISSTWFSAI